MRRSVVSLPFTPSSISTSVCHFSLTHVVYFIKSLSVIIHATLYPGDIDFDRGNLKFSHSSAVNTALSQKPPQQTRKQFLLHILLNYQAISSSRRSKIISLPRLIRLMPRARIKNPLIRLLTSHLLACRDADIDARSIRCTGPCGSLAAAVVVAPYLAGVGGVAHIR